MNWLLLVFALVWLVTWLISNDPLDIINANVFIAASLIVSYLRKRE